MRARLLLQADWKIRDKYGKPLAADYYRDKEAARAALGQFFDASHAKPKNTAGMAAAKAALKAARSI